MSGDYPKFVYIFGPKGPCPQIWPEKSASVAEGKPIRVLSSRTIPEDQRGLSINDLSKLYPFKGMLEAGVYDPNAK